MFSDKCRVCLNAGLLTSVFNKMDSVMISTKIMSLAEVQIHPDDGLPNKICSKCKKNLKRCFSFIKQCENSDSKLRGSLNNSCDIDSQKVDGGHAETDLAGSDNEYSILDCELLIVEGEDTGLRGNKFKNISDTHEKNEKEEKILNKKHKNRKVTKQQCFICGKVMSSRFRLLTHLKIHTGEKTFSCPHCNKMFTLEQNLKVHIRTHSGEKPLSCSECGALFAQSAGLIAHRRKHTGETPYTCSLCPRRFRTAGHLQYHLRCHKGERNFECDTCGRTFIRRSDLKQHIAIHSGVKPHVCSVCGLHLRRAAHLRRHSAVHDGRKALPCQLCPLKFVRKLDLEEHLKKHEAKRKEES